MLLAYTLKLYKDFLGAPNLKNSSLLTKYHLNKTLRIVHLKHLLIQHLDQKGIQTNAL